MRLGLARAGSYAGDGSGEIGLAFSASSAGGPADAELDSYFAAAYEAARESVYNCLVAARPARRRDVDGREGTQFGMGPLRKPGGS